MSTEQTLDRECAEARRQIDAAVDGGEPPAELARHLAACPTCGVVWQRQLAVVAGLRAGADALCPRPPDDLAARTLAALDAPPPRAHRPVMHLILASAAAAAVMVLALGRALHDPAPAPRPQRAAAEPAAEALVVTRRPVAASPRAPLAALIDAPLDDEAQRLLQDATAAGRFLVDCLPDPPRLPAGL
ncbi:MAG: hypothetical protein ACOCZK_03025 [Planctomycetota bacterium]